MNNVPKFTKKSVLQHVKTQKIYVVLKTPNKCELLEDCREPFYKYIGSDGVKWYRCQSQMEDGRFALIEPLLNMEDFIESPCVVEV